MCGSESLNNASVARPSALRVVGAGLPRTGTSTLKIALSRLLGVRCFHMNEIPGHPFELGAPWQAALSDATVAWDTAMPGYGAAVDWPASAFWRQLASAHPDALVLLSTRSSADAWFESIEATILPYARLAQAPTWAEQRDLDTLLERFAGTRQWDDPATLKAAYERHNLAVRTEVAASRLLDWQPTDGWAPLCAALGVREPDEAFPWTNRREEWS